MVGAKPTRSRHHDQPGVEAEQRVGAQPELLHHPRREVLDDRVGPAHQLLEQAAALFGLQVEGDRALVGVHGVEHPAVLPPVVDVGAHPAGVADAVGPLDRLDLDHVGAERSQRMGGGGPGPERGEVDDPDTRKRQPPCGLHRTVFPWRPVDSGVPDTGRGPHRRGPGRRHQPWRPRLPEPGGIVDVDPAFAQVVHLRDGRAVADRRQRQPEQLAELDDLGDGAGAQPRVDPFPDEVAVVPAAELEPQFGNLGQLRAFHHRDEVQPLLSGDHADADVAVLGRFDGRHLHRPPYRRHPHQRRVQPLGALHQRDRLQHRQVQMPTGPAAAHPPVQRERPERRPHPGHVLAQVAPDGDGRPGGVTAESGEARLGLQRELVGRPVRASAAEGGDRHDHAPGRAVQLVVGVEVGAVGDDDVGAGQQGVGKCCDGPFPGVEIAEQWGIAARFERRAGDGVPAQRIATGRFDRHHVGARIGQQLAAVRPRDPAADLHDPQSVERGLSHTASRVFSPS
jgi:hypothetical protein